MDELYDDLENYDDVDTVNQLKSANSDLQHLLDERNKTIENLQKDLDKLAADFKSLQNNYSSLLKIARAEVQRKTDMITKLNIEKDTLIIAAAQKVPPNEIQKLLNNVKTEAKRKKKKKRDIAEEGPKEKTEFIRRESKRLPSSESSSTATDNSNKMVGNERVMDNTKTSITVTQENEFHKREAFPDQRGDGNRSPVAVDRRVSALAGHQFSKLSSDEEFEDLYSALKPEASLREPERSLREPERNRKRGRDKSEDSKKFYNNTHDRPSNYPDPFRERFNRNRTGRFSNNDRNINRDKKYNESDRHVNRDKQYDSNKSDKYNSHYQRDSPERHCRGAKELSDDRYTQQYDRNRRLASPPWERKQHRSRERRRSCHDRERDDLKQDALRYKQPETHTVRHHIHGEYDEPQNKRPRIDPPWLITRKDGRQSEKQGSNEMYLSNMRENTCQSPDFSHEEASNEHITEIRSTALTVLEDPRVISKKYVKSSEGHKEVLKSVNANKIHLQPVNKSLWNLQEVQVPKALTSRPSEISEELVDEMDIDKPSSVISMESGEIGSETTDTVIEDVTDFHEGNQSNYKYGFSIRDSQKIEKKHRKEKSRIENIPEVIQYKSDKLEKLPKEKHPIDKENSHKSDLNKSPLDNTFKNIGHKSDLLEKEPKTRSKIVKSEKANSDKPTTVRPSDNTSVNANKIHLQPVNKSEVSEELGNEMDIDKPSSIKSMESGEIGSETTDTVIEDVSDFQEGNQTNYKYGLCKRDSQRIEKKHRKEKSPIENISEGIQYKSDKLEKLPKEKYPTDKENSYKSDLEKSSIDNTFKDIDLLEKESKTRSKLVKSEKANNRKSDKSRTVPPRDNKVATNTHINTTQIPSILHRLIHSIDKSPGRDNSDKSRRSEEEKEHKETSESKRSDKTEQETSRTKEQKEHKKSSEPEKVNKSSVQIVREFEHRVYSTRHIVEGDLELSDESNDETQLKIDEKKIDTKVKQKIRRKSTRDISEEKPVDLEEMTRKTRSKKDKGKEQTTNKFSELFGDSSSLITPEDLNLATRVAHALPTECCPPAPEDAQDGIIESQQSFQTLPSKVLDSISEAKESPDGSTIEEDKTKAKVTKNSRNRTHKRHKKSESVLVSDDTHKAPAEQELSEPKKKKVNSTETPSVTEVKLLLLNEKLKQMENATITTDKNKKYALKPIEKPKGSVKSNKRVKNKDETILSISDPERKEESNTMKTSDTLEANSNKIFASDNKENASSNDKSEGNISSEMARIFENTLVSDVSKVNTEKQPLHDTAKDTISSTVVEDVPNLAPVIDEPGLVKTVVMSTGIQLLDSNSAQCTSAFNALTSSTPVRDLSIVNYSSEIEPVISHSAHVSVTIERDDTVSQPENDAPDMRINYYSRRRKVLKR